MQQERGSVIDDSWFVDVNKRIAENYTVISAQKLAEWEALIEKKMEVITQSPPLQKITFLEVLLPNEHEISQDMTNLLGVLGTRNPTITFVFVPRISLTMGHTKDILLRFGPRTIYPSASILYPMGGGPNASALFPMGGGLLNSFSSGGSVQQNGASTSSLFGKPLNTATGSFGNTTSFGSFEGSYQPMFSQPAVAQYKPFGH